MGELIYLGKDVIATLTKTNFPTGTPVFDEADIDSIFILSGVTATATVPQVIDAYNATDWADAAKPAVATHIMVSVADRQWKAKDALAAGDMMMAMVRPKGEKVKTS
jgi:hypothetical protein